MKRCNPHTLSRYLDGELSLPARTALEQHLLTCPTCSQELEALRRLDKVVESWGGRRQPISIESETRILQSVVRRRRSRRAASLAKMMPAAVGTSVAALVVLVSANVGWLYQSEPRLATPMPAAHVQRVSANQPASLVNAVRIAELQDRRGAIHPDLEKKYRALFNFD